MPHERELVVLLQDATVPSLHEAIGIHWPLKQKMLYAHLFYREQIVWDSPKEWHTH